jgi:hypothetical protein
MHFGPATELVREKDSGGTSPSKDCIGRSWLWGDRSRRIPPMPMDPSIFAKAKSGLMAQFTNERQVRVRYPHYELFPEPPGPPLFGLWIGHDALRWAREDSKRLPAYEYSPTARRMPEMLGYGFRPAG